MKLNIRLTEESIESAIRKLEDAQEELQASLGEFVDFMVTDGAEIANSYYGNMAKAWGQRDEDDDGIVTGHIGVSGDSQEAVYIAEFGAGDATLPVQFENYPGVDVYPGAYSEQVGTKEYFLTGKWHFGSTEFTAIQPRAGLLNAKHHILLNGDDLAKEVIRI